MLDIVTEPDKRQELKDVDRHVGLRVRLRRMEKGLSQTTLGDACGVTWQQAQKYESGANRISAGKLLAFSHLLGVPVSDFFEGAPGPEQQPAGDNDVLDFVSSAEGLQLNTAFSKIENVETRRKLVGLVKTLAS